MKRVEVRREEEEGPEEGQGRDDGGAWPRPGLTKPGKRLLSKAWAAAAAWPGLGLGPLGAWCGVLKTKRMKKNGSGWRLGAAAAWAWRGGLKSDPDPTQVGRPSDEGEGGQEGQGPVDLGGRRAGRR